METIDSQLQQLGEQGQPCAECGAPLAADQRYCLNCGRRRAEPRLPFREHLAGISSPAGEGGSTGAPPPPVPSSGRDWTPVWAIGALAALGVMLVVGVLLGKGSDKAPVVKVGSGGPATAATGGGTSLNTSNEPFKSDWPSGKEGWTVEVGSLPKSGTTASDVAAQKSQVSSQGASDVGALDSDQYPSLPAGKYIVYSGVYDTKAQASKALQGLKGKFPDATVIQVSSKGGGGGGNAGLAPGVSKAVKTDKGAVQISQSQVSSLNSASGKGYEKASKNIPDTVQTQGKPPPIDTSKAPGAGGGAQVIK